MIAKLYIPDQKSQIGLSGQDYGPKNKTPHISHFLLAARLRSLAKHHLGRERKLWVRVMDEVGAVKHVCNLGGKGPKGYFPKIGQETHTFRIETRRVNPLSRVEVMVTLSLFFGGLLLRPLFVAELLVELDDLRRDGIIRTMVEGGRGREQVPSLYQDEPPSRRAGLWAGIGTGEGGLR